MKNYRNLLLNRIYRNKKEEDHNPRKIKRLKSKKKKKPK